MTSFEELAEQRAKAIDLFYSTRGNKTDVVINNVDEYVVTLTRNDETDKYLLRVIDSTTQCANRNIVCVYNVVKTSLVDTHNTLVTFERIGECTNYLTMVKTVQADENGAYGDVVELRPNDYRHVFKQVEVTI